MKRTPLKLKLTTAQTRSIVEIQRRCLMESPEPIALGLLDFALKFCDVYGYGVIAGIATGQGPAELSPESLQTLVRRRRNQDMVFVGLTARELRDLCENLSDELRNDSMLDDFIGIEEGDFAGALAAWRKYSLRYVRDSVRSGESARAAKAALEMHNASADLLDRLIQVKCLRHD